MRVIDLNTGKACEIGLFEDSAWEHALKIRLLELPLIFGKRGVHAGFLEAWAGDEADEEDGISYSLDSDAIQFFELIDPFQEILDCPLAALKSIIYESPRFRASRAGRLIRSRA